MHDAAHDAVALFRRDKLPVLPTIHGTPQQQTEHVFVMRAPLDAFGARHVDGRLAHFVGEGGDSQQQLKVGVRVRFAGSCAAHRANKIPNVMDWGTHERHNQKARRTHRLNRVSSSFMLARSSLMRSTTNT